MFETTVFDDPEAFLRRVSTCLNALPDTPRPAAGELSPAAVLVPLMYDANRIEILLTRRTPTLRLHAGQVSFPGGRMDDADATLLDTALRETHEELGVGRARLEVLGALNSRRTGTGFQVYPIVARLASDAAVTPNPAEVAGLIRLPIAIAMDRKRYLKGSRILGGQRREFHAIHYDGHEIWGATAAMLMELAERLECSA